LSVKLSGRKKFCAQKFRQKKFQSQKILGLKFFKRENSPALIPESTMNKSGCSGVNHLSGRGNFPGNNFLLPKIFMKFFFHAQFLVVTL
jgi:hypothetical protein